MQTQCVFCDTIGLFRTRLFSLAELTVAAVELDRVGRQVDGNALVVGLRKFEILDLAVRAEYVHIQDCQAGAENTRGQRRRSRIFKKKLTTRVVRPQRQNSCEYKWHTFVPDNCITFFPPLFFTPSPALAPAWGHVSRKTVNLCASGRQRKHQSQS